MGVHVQNCAHVRTQITRKCHTQRLRLGFSASVQMTCLSSERLCEKYRSYKCPIPLSNGCFHVAYLGSNSLLLLWNLMICTSTLWGWLSRAFNPPRYDTMQDVVSSITIPLHFLFVLSPYHNSLLTLLDCVIFLLIQQTALYIKFCLIG